MQPLEKLVAMERGRRGNPVPASKFEIKERQNMKRTILKTTLLVSALSGWALAQPSPICRLQAAPAPPAMRQHRRLPRGLLNRATDRVAA
jgi:hypothetical protein